MSADPTPDLFNVTGSLHPEIDPWGILVVGSPRGVGPLCSEAGRLGFELLRRRRLTPSDDGRLRDTDWAVAVVVEDGTDLSPTTSVLQDNLPANTPLIWVGDDPVVPAGRPVTHLPQQSEPEWIAATAFDRARTYLYPQPLTGPLVDSFERVMGDWGEPSLALGPVWVKNHFTAPFSMSVVFDLFGDVSGELSISASVEWFQRKVDRCTPTEVAGQIGGQVLEAVLELLQRGGADVSAGPARVITDGSIIRRTLSHRPALCLEFATPERDLLVLEFSGTGLESLKLPLPG